MIIASILLVAQMSMGIAPSTLTEDTPTEIVAVTKDGVGELTLVATSVDAGTVARGATRIPVLSIEASASCDAAVQIGEITLRHTGRGSAADITGVYVGAEFRRVSRSAQADSRGLVRLRLQNVSVAPCEVLPLMVYVNVSTDAEPTGEHGLILESPSDVSSSAKTITLASDMSTDATVVASPRTNGAITVRFLPVSARIRYGRTETLARIQISADSEGSHVLRSITLTNEENARDYDFLDLRLEDTRGTEVTRKQPHMDGRTVTLLFDPTFVLEKNQTRVFLVRSKVNGSLKKKIRFTIEEEADLVATPYRMQR